MWKTLGFLSMLALATPGCATFPPTGPAGAFTPPGFDLVRPSTVHDLGNGIRLVIDDQFRCELFEGEVSLGHPTWDDAE